MWYNILIVIGSIRVTEHISCRNNRNKHIFINILRIKKE